ncbi:thioredoxin reductase [Puniceibacterium sp. IMCC21224]|nr:thioredoxin reductase [Puniceibacterium sp. IMCC21224]
MLRGDATELLVAKPDGFAGSVFDLVAGTVIVDLSGYGVRLCAVSAAPESRRAVRQRWQVADIFDALVIGGGPAGAQCALWLRKLGVRSTLIEPIRIGGLQARSPYTNSWLSVVQATTAAHSVARNIENNLIAQDCSIQRAECLNVSQRARDGLFEVRTNEGLQLCRHVVLATGTRERTGGLATLRDTAVGLVGVFHAESAGRRVAILGGGDAAGEAYDIVQSKGASDIRVFARTVRARGPLWSKIPPDRIHSGGYEVSEGQVVAADQRFDCDLMVICYGWTPVLPDLGFTLQKDAIGHVTVDAAMETSLPGCFAIGDLNDRPYPCVTTALSDGVFAAKAIEARVQA